MPRPSGVLLCFVCVALVMLAPSPALRAAGPSARHVLDETGVGAGVVVHVGAADESLGAGIAKAGEFVVLIVVDDDAAGGEMRRRLSAEGLLGRVSVAVVREKRVPLVTNCAALLVAKDGALDIGREELLRVVRPGGVAYLETGGQWKATLKPRPAEMDDWPQYFHDGAATDYSQDTLVGPARGLQWQTGDHDLHGAKMGYRSVGGVVVKIEGEGDVVARDGFSGSPLWRRSDLKVQNRYAFLVDEHRVYLHSGEPGWTRIQAQMIALDLRSGETLLKYDQGYRVEYADDERGHRKPVDQSHEDLIARVSDGVLVQAARGGLWALDAATGKRLWHERVSQQGRRWMHPAATDGKLFVLQGEPIRSFSYTHWPMTTCERIAAFDLKTGKRRWEWSWPGDWDEPDAAYNMVYGQGKLALALRDGQDKGAIKVLTLDAESGRAEHYVDGPWRAHGDKPQTTGGGHSHLRTMIRDGQIWISQIHGSAALSLADPAEIVIDAHVGLRPVGCTVWRMTPNYVLGSLTAVNPDGQGMFHTNAARTCCDVGSFPANGLQYLPPNNCGCLSYVPVSNAFHSEKPPPPGDFERLERGPGRPAATSGGAKPGGAWPADDEWPMFLRDPGRTNWTDQQIAEEPKIKWQTRVESSADDEAAPLLAQDAAEHPFIEAVATPVTVAEGVCLTAVPHDHAVVALDAETGERKWRILVDGRVDSPPTIYRGMALFGARNGWVYAVARDTGETIWRFFAAPRGRRIMANGQLESAWPVFGTVLVDDGEAWVFAGRNVDLDGGIHWYRLRPETGDVLGSGRLGFDELLTAGDVRGRLLGSNSPPASDGRRLVFHNFVFDKATGRATPHTPWVAQRLDAPTPCHRGLVHNGHSTTGLNAHSHCYGTTRGWMIAYRGQDYVSILGTTERGNRGGNPAALALRLRRDPNDRDDDGRRSPEVKWQYGRPNNYWGRGGYFGIKAVAKAGDKVLVVASPEGFDGRHDREKNLHFLLALDYETGQPLGGAAANEKRGIRAAALLPTNGIYAGLAVAYGRVYVTCKDGTVVCLH